MTQKSNVKFKKKIKNDGACSVMYPSNSGNKLTRINKINHF